MIGDGVTWRQYSSTISHELHKYWEFLTMPIIALGDQYRAAIVSIRVIRGKYAAVQNSSLLFNLFSVTDRSSLPCPPIHNAPTDNTTQALSACEFSWL